MEKKKDIMNNTVELIDWYGGDKAIARAAWCSTQIDVDSRTDEQIRHLIVNCLWNNGSGKPHRTPFERGLVEFNVTCEAASHVHMIKHRHASINGESARYKELKEDRYYVPEDWDGINVNLDWDNAKDEHGFHLGVPFRCADIKDWSDMLGWYTRLGNFLYHSALNDLETPLGRKRAKESARFFKTYNSQVTLSVMMNMSCFENFQKLRNDSAAQLEIREISAMMLEQVANIEGQPFKHTLEAWGYD